MKNIPKLFSKTYKKKKFNKKILKRIYTANDKEWIEELFEEKDGTVSLKEQQFKKEDIKRLKQLAKSIKKNRGLFNKKLFIPLVIILSALVVFNIIFMDRLLEKAIEIQAGNILETEVYVENLDLQVLRGRITVGALAVKEENSDRLTILIENLDADIDTGELLKKKVFIEKMGFSNLAFETEKPYEMKSAWSPPPERAAREENAPEKSSGSPVIPLPTLPDLDPESIWESERENLALYKSTVGAQEKYEALYNERMESIDSVQKQSESIIGESKALMNEDLDQYKTDPTKIPARVKELENFKTKVVSAKDDVTAVYDNVTGDINTIKEEALALRENFDSDKAYLMSKIQLPEGGLKTLASDLALAYVKEHFNSYYSKAMKFKGYYDKAAALKGHDSDKKKTSSGRRTGRTLDFNQKVSPAFVLQAAEGSWSIGGSRQAVVALNDATSDPENWSEEPTASAVYASSRENWAVDALAPKNSDNLVNSAVNGSGISLSVTDYMDTIGVDKLDASMAIITDPHFTKEGTLMGDLDIILDNLVVSKTEGAGLVQREIAGVLENAGEIILGGSYTFHDNGRQDFTLKSNLDDLMKDAVSDIMNEKAAEAREALNDYLNSYLEQAYKDNEEILARFGVQEDLLNQDLTSLDTYSGLIDDQKDSVTDAISAEADKLKAQAQAEADKLKAEAEAEAAKARAEADKKKAEAEAEAARLKAEAEKKKADEEARLKAEAEARAKEAAKDKIKLPGW